MPAEQSTLQRSSQFSLYAGVFILIFCELQVVIQLWSKGGLHKLDFDFYLLPFLLPMPLLAVLALRRRLKLWQASGEVSLSAVGQINLNTGYLILLGYLLFMMVAPK